MRNLAFAAAIAGVALMGPLVPANAQAGNPSAAQTIRYIKSKLSHLNVHYYSENEAGLPKIGRRINITGIKVSPSGRMALTIETSSAPNYLPSDRYRVVMCLSDIATVHAGDNEPSQRSQPYEFWLQCKKRGTKRIRCVESHDLEEKNNKTVRLYTGYRVRVAKKDERQGPKLMRAFAHLRRLNANKSCRRDREPF